MQKRKKNVGDSLLLFKGNFTIMKRELQKEMDRKRKRYAYFKTAKRGVRN